MKIKRGNRNVCPSFEREEKEHQILRPFLSEYPLVELK